VHPPPARIRFRFEGLVDRAAVKARGVRAWRVMWAGGAGMPMPVDRRGKVDSVE
jgi:hypothetical protein